MKIGANKHVTILNLGVPCRMATGKPISPCLGRVGLRGVGPDLGRGQIQAANGSHASAGGTLLVSPEEMFAHVAVERTFTLTIRDGETGPELSSSPIAFDYVIPLSTGQIALMAEFAVKHLARGGPTCRRSSRSPGLMPTQS